MRIVAASQPPSGGCVLKQHNAAYSRTSWSQPPSGGCVLKPEGVAAIRSLQAQPPSGGCVLKHDNGNGGSTRLVQPPSGGCVLKLILVGIFRPCRTPAAFRRLCVETFILSDFMRHFSQPPSGGCVLKHLIRMCLILRLNQPPSGGCVLKPLHSQTPQDSNDPAAFRRLCVETDSP